jgi:MinD superfamily P-loop ATPase
VKIAIASGKGGTGKTTVAVNLYRALNHERAKQALLVDCDVEEPNDLLFFDGFRESESSPIIQEIPSIDTTRCTFCRLCAEYCEFNAIVVIPPAGFAEINPSLCHSCGACEVACKSEAIWVRDEPVGTRKSYMDRKGNEIIEGRLKIGSAMQTLVIRSVKNSLPEGSEVCILDAPPGTSCPVVETVNDADYVLLVTEPTPFGLHDLKMMVELVREMGIPFGAVVNKSQLGDRELYHYLEKEQIEIIGEIPFSRAYASQYAKADLFGDIPEEIKNSHQQILQRLSEKGLIPKTRHQ